MILFSFGTRPEIIKLFPLIRACEDAGIAFRTVFTGQHQDLFEDVRHLIPEPDFRLEVMDGQQRINKVTKRIIDRLDDLLEDLRPGLLIVQGDTTTVMASALAAYYRAIPVGHLEAGIRTNDIMSPFPEEGNRQMVSRIASFNWAPTKHAAGNLEKEGITRFEVTGNTVIDACHSFDLHIEYGRKVLVTLHRRENFGMNMRMMCEQINRLALYHQDLEFIFPMHPNPRVREMQHLLPAVNVCDPLPYQAFLKLLSSCKFVISDSGGLQEECAAFQKKILVCRAHTGRPEGIHAGFAKLVHTRIEEHFAWANSNPRWHGDNPYGDGKASQKIVESIRKSGILDFPGSERTRKS